MEIDSLIVREQRRKKMGKWILGTTSIVILIVCPFLLFILYLEGLDPVLTLFWALMMLSMDIFMGAFAIRLTRRKRSKYTISEQTETIPIEREAEDVKRTKQEFKAFWEGWDFFDNKEKEKDIEAPEEMVPRKLEGPPKEEERSD
jgi:hypothetical protein